MKIASGKGWPAQAPHSTLLYTEVLFLKGHPAAACCRHVSLQLTCSHQNLRMSLQPHKDAYPNESFWCLKKLHKAELGRILTGTQVDGVLS